MYTLEFLDFVSYYPSEMFITRNGISFRVEALCFFVRKHFVLYTRYPN